MPRESSTTLSEASVDPRRIGVHRPVAKRDVPYVPTDEPVVMAMLRFAGVSGSDVVYDLGCGDGRIVVAAAKHFGARGVGVDIDPLRIQEARDNARRAGVSHLVQFHCQSFFDTHVRDASVVMLYLLPSINLKLKPKLLAEMRPGSRIVANYFEIGDWEPDMRAEAHHRILLQWIIPAWVAGAWRCTIDDPSGRWGMVLDLTRKYQNVTGTARIGRRRLPISNGRLFGDQLTFKVNDLRHGAPAVRFSCRVDHNHLRGTCQLDGFDSQLIPWGAIWRSAGEVR